MNKTNFCSLPFTEIFLGPDGGIKTCCSARDPIGNLQTGNINSILSSPKAAEIRQSIIDGKWHPQCIQCQRQEEQGARSERKGDLDEFQQENKNISKYTFTLKRLDLRWSNTCNLSCTYCYEYFSSKWAQLKGMKVNAIKDEAEEELFLLIEQNKSSINSIMLLGGEPLLQKQNTRLIKNLTGRSFYVLSNLAIPLETNKVGQMLINEPFAKIGVSFETVGKRYEYVRHGAKWEVFINNVKYLHSCRSDHRLEAHSLYSIYSAFNLVEFYNFILENEFRDVYWNLLESSGESAYASVLNLSSNLRERAVREIEEVERQFPHAHGVDQLRSFKTSLLLEKSTATNKKFIIEHDTIENRYLINKEYRFKDLWPDIYNELKNGAT